jgi:hypothetical protein
MAARTKEEVTALIDSLDVDFLWKKAREKGTVGLLSRGKATTEYKHFLFLLWLNTMEGNTEFVVPSERADAVWHEHILFTREYLEFSEKLVGQMIHHNPGLEKGTAPFDRAVEHTRKLHMKNRADAKQSQSTSECGGYVTMYLGASDAPSSAPGGGGSKAGATCGGDGGSCGGSCGGGGCGG